MRRPPPERFDEWMALGRRIVSAAQDDHELQYIEAWAKILGIEARAERLGRLSTPKPPVTEEHGAAMSARECAHESGWSLGQVPRRGYSPRWFYDHWSELPFAIKPPQGRVRRFAQSGFVRWLAAQR